MRPSRSFIFLLIFILTLTGLHYIRPFSAVFPSVSQTLPAGKNKKPAPVEVITAASGKGRNGIASDTNRLPPVPAVRTPVTVPGSGVPDPFDSFLDSVNSSARQIRIVYYGDSQIEGDRMTSMLRTILRESAGGTGPGLFQPVIPIMYSKTLWLTSSANWKRYNYLSYTQGDISHTALGPFMSVCRFLPDGKVSVTEERAFVRIRPSAVSDSSSAVFDWLRIFYGNAAEQVAVSVTADGNPVFSGFLEQGQGFREVSCRLKGGKDILVEFSGKSSPDIYCMSIESSSGVILDNISQRGSTGLEFTMVDRENLAESLRILSPDMVIINYGLNVVRNVRDTYGYYEKGLKLQLSLLRDLLPSAAIMVVGVTDMASMRGDSIVSYKNIPSIIAAQRRAAKAAGVMFWDSYSAMGGDSSAIKWFHRDVPLMQQDLVHLTYRGADTLASMMADDLFRGKLLRKYQAETGNIAVTPAGNTRVAGKVADNDKRWPESGDMASGSLISTVFGFDPDHPLIYSNPVFWLFFLIVLAGYLAVYRRLFLRNTYLFLISLFFYYKSGGLFLFLLIVVTVIDYACGILIHRSGRTNSRRMYLLVSIISNLGILAYFKYSGFFINSLNDLLGTHITMYNHLASASNSILGTAFDIRNIILPVGISFFTFQSLSYTIDVYREKLEPVRSIVDFGFYVSFFPQLVAGPIVRASEFIPQLYMPFSLSKREACFALYLIAKGLIKKVVISDFIAVNFVDRIFDAPGAFSGFENLMAVYGYGLQIYCDFSGYTDIAIGLGLLLGFRLPGNFNAPYKASDVADFWKRWHISLSRWLKDYLYIPLGGNRKGRLRTGINLMLTMLLGGLWHGASLRFIIWGGLHGLGLVFNRIWRSLFGEPRSKQKMRRALGVFLTFNFVSFCWIFFRAKDFESIQLILNQIIHDFSPGSWPAAIRMYGSVFMLMLAGYMIHLLPEKVKESYRGIFIRIPVAAQFAIMIVVAALLFSMRTTEVLPFIYFRF